MKQKILMEKYPIFEFEIGFDETKFKNTDEVIAHLKTKIDEHPVARFIAIFDHFHHTKSLSDGMINEGIKDAKNIICCFGKELPKPEVLAVRPRSIGVAQMTDRFVVSFLEAPNPAANSAMENWVKSIANI